MVIKSEITREEMLGRWVTGEGLAKVKGRCCYINTIPQNTKWYLVDIPITKNEFDSFYTVKYKNWIKYSNGSCRLCDSTNYLIQNRNEDKRVSSIIDNLSSAILSGITFIASDTNGPYTIVEGTGRMVAMYCNYIIQKKQPPSNIEAVLGISDQKWCWAPEFR